MTQYYILKIYLFYQNSKLLKIHSQVNLNHLLKRIYRTDNETIFIVLFCGLNSFYVRMYLNIIILLHCGCLNEKLEVTLNFLCTFYFT